MAVFDMRTLMAFIAVTHMVFGLLLVLHWLRIRDSWALLTWSVASEVAALAWFLIAMRGLVPDLLSIAVGNGLLITAWVALLVGMRQFAGRRVVWPYVAAPGLIVFLLFTAVPPVRDSLGARVMVVNVSLLLCLLLLISDALGDQRREPLQARWIVVVSVSIAVVSNLTRAILAFQVDPGSSFLTSGAAQEIGVFVQGAALLGWNVGVLLMTTERLENRLHDSARRDVLTGVLNRRGFGDAARRYLPCGSGSVALLVIDLDHFKNVNDTHGHEAGDRLLRVCAQALDAQLRPGELLGRHGGEEFCLLLPDTDQATAELRADAFRRAVGQAYAAGGDGAPLSVTASVGVAVAVATAATGPEELLRQADAALYQAKRDGRDRVRVAAPESVGDGVVPSIRGLG